MIQWIPGGSFVVIFVVVAVICFCCIVAEKAPWYLLSLPHAPETDGICQPPPRLPPPPPVSVSCVCVPHNVDAYIFMSRICGVCGQIHKTHTQRDNAPRCAYEQGLLPRNLDVDGRVSMTNLNGTMKARPDGSVKVLVLRPGGGGPNNPSVCR